MSEVIFIKKLAILIIVPLLLILSSCEKNDKINFLGHQAYPFEAYGKLTFDGKEYEALVSVKKRGDVILQIVKPENLKGVVFELSDGEVFVKTSGLTQQINDGGYAAKEGILLSANMFSLSGDNLLDVQIVSENNVNYNRAEYAVSCGTVNVFVQNGLEAPEKLTANLNGHVFSFVFMNEY